MSRGTASSFVINQPISAFALFALVSGMPVTPKRVQQRALSLENVSAAPHFDRIAFRTPRRTFATLALSGSDVNFMLDLAQQKEFCEQAPEAISPVSGGWGRMGWTHCDLSKVPARTFDALLAVAHANANAPKPKRSRSKPKP